MNDVDYLPLHGSRYHEFLTSYPSDQFGIRIRRERLNEWLLEQLVRADPVAASELIQAEMLEPTFVFTAELIELARDVVIRTASAKAACLEVKDFESAETAALQRVVAACGFDGGSMEADELRDWAKASRQARESSTSGKTHEAKTTAQSSSSPPEDQSARNADHADDRSASERPALPAQLRKIEHQAAQKGIEAGTFPGMTIQQARARIKEVMQASHQ